MQSLSVQQRLSCQVLSSCLCARLCVARARGTHTGDTEEIDVSAADFMTTFQDLMAEMLGGLSIQARALSDIHHLKLLECAGLCGACMLT
jgi:hypothetical protein